METDMLLHIDFPNATRFMKMEKQVPVLDISPNELDQIKLFLKEVVHTLSSERLFNPDKKDIVKNVKASILSYSPSLSVRNTGGRLWQHELTNAIGKIKASFPFSH